MLSKSDKRNFETLQQAFEQGDVALVELQRVSDGKVVAGLVAVGRDGEEITMTPFATLVEGNPFELFRPPNPGGGFHPTEAEEQTGL